jgi:hypothetical protein
MKRQGDVLLVKVASVPAGLKRTKKVTLAYGEATGHHHSIFGGAVGFADDEEGLAQYIEVKDKATLVHQEHDPITIDEGIYKSVIQVEYTPEAIRNVAD